jgi:hypothetical protein
VDLSDSEESEYEAIMHPNEANKKKKEKHVHTGCAKYMHRFDEMIMKPIFIYKYERSMQKKSKEFFKIFMKAGT